MCVHVSWCRPDRMMIVRWGPTSMHRGARQAFVAIGIAVLLPLDLASSAAHGAQRAKAQVTARLAEPEATSVVPPTPLKLPDAQLDPIEWTALDGWVADDHAAAFAAFLTSCGPLARALAPQGESRPMYAALRQVCRRALAAGRLGKDAARHFFERNFRPLRVSK